MQQYNSQFVFLCDCVAPPQGLTPFPMILPLLCAGIFFITSQVRLRVEKETHLSWMCLCVCVCQRRINMARTCCCFSVADVPVLLSRDKYILAVYECQIEFFNPLRPGKRKAGFRIKSLVFFESWRIKAQQCVWRIVGKLNRLVTFLEFVKCLPMTNEIYVV